jgi:hypothetical protein
MKSPWLLCCLWGATLAATAAEPPNLEPDELGDVRIPLSASELRGEPPAIVLRAPVPPILSLHLEENRAAIPVLVFNRDATEARIEFSPSFEGNATLKLGTAPQSGQLRDGRILFSAIDAQVRGEAARLESNPGNARIGYWTRLDDRVVWDHEATRPGTYLVQITYALAGEAQSDVTLEVGEDSISRTIAGTGSWYRYRSIDLGLVRIPNQGTVSLSVFGTRMTGPALMNLKAITLRPAPEGEPIVQRDSGEIVCHARDVTIHGIKVQYEPRPEKNTVGFWTRAEDFVSWTFRVDQPGEFDVEILQGCGKGHGGSEVAVTVDGQRLDFVVEDTGHFQNFKPRIIGRVRIAKAGNATLAIVPQTKASLAVMDVRQVRLIPIEDRTPE